MRIRVADMFGDGPIVLPQQVGQQPRTDPTGAGDGVSTRANRLAIRVSSWSASTPTLPALPRMDGE